MDVSEAAERIFSAINSDIDEIGIIFVQNGLDVIVEDNGKKMGIPHLLIPQLFKHVRTLPDGDKKWFISVICSGDNYSAWARRKELFESGELSLAAYEMRVVDLVLSKQPKSGGAWEHRRFILERALKACKTSEGLRALLLNEVLLCERVCTRHPRTYFAWAHRAWASGWMSVSQLKDDQTMSKKWITKNLSDGSAFNHLDLVNGLIFARSSEYILNIGKQTRYLVAELEWCTVLCQRFPGHESMWMYRRSLARYLMDMCAELSKSDRNALRRAFQTLDLDARLVEKDRFRLYDWWVRTSTDMPPLDCVLQVLFDELAYATRLGLWQEAEVDEFSLYAEIDKKHLLHERRYALAYAGWLAELFSQKLFKRLDEERTVKRIGPGCLRGIDVDTFVQRFREETITKDLFRRTFCELSGDFDEQAIAALFDACDLDASGELSRREFLAGAVVICSGNDSGRSKIRKSFELLDTNRNGSLDSAEIHHYCLSVFRIVACSNPAGVRGIDMEALAKASVQDAFTFSSNQSSLSCDEFCDWLRSSSAGMRDKPRALERYRELLVAVEAARKPCL